MTLGGSFYELLTQDSKVEVGVKRVDERRPVEYRPRVEILTEGPRLPARDGRQLRSLGVVVGEQVLPEAPQGLETTG